MAQIVGKQTYRARFARVFGLIRSESLLAEVTAVLDASGFRIVSCPGPETPSMGGEIGPVVFEVGNGDARLALIPSPIQTARGPLIQISGGTAFSRTVPPPPPTGPGFLPRTFILPSQNSDFLSAVRWAWVAARSRRVRASVLRSPDYHTCLKAAIIKIVRVQPTGEGSWVPEEATHGVCGDLGLIAGLAAKYSISPDHLSRLAKRQSISLRRVHDSWRMVLGVVHRMEEGSWERAAFMLGFETCSALTALAKRSIGASPRGLESSPDLGLSLAAGSLMASLNIRNREGEDW